MMRCRPINSFHGIIFLNFLYMAIILMILSSICLSVISLISKPINEIALPSSLDHFSSLLIAVYVDLLRLIGIQDVPPVANNEDAALHYNNELTSYFVGMAMLLFRISLNLVYIDFHFIIYGFQISHANPENGKNELKNKMPSPQQKSIIQIQILMINKLDF